MRYITFRTYEISTVFIFVRSRGLQISSITADNVDVYKNAVSKMSDAMDANIKVNYDTA